MRCIRFAFAAALFLAASCAKEESPSYDRFEDQSLEAWIVQNKPALAANRQEFGEASYYIDVLDAGDPEAAPVSDTVCWVKFDFSGRDLASNILLTRRAAEAKLAGTFTKYTHYVPFYRYCGTANTGLLEATYLALRNEQTLGEEYVEEYNRTHADRPVSSRLLLREGSRVVLYCPSRIIGDMSASGGYEGDLTLSSGKPVVIEMCVRDTIKNPLAAEGTAVDAFCRDGRNGGLRIYNASEDAPAGTVPLPTDPDDPNHPYNEKVTERWVSVCDSVPQLYVNYRYTPDEQFVFPEPYAVGIEPYVADASMEAIDRKISEALRKRFLGDDETASYPDVRTLDADSVDMEKKTKIWYITRFLDGFVLDTNIDEVKRIVFGEVKSAGAAYDVSQSANTPIAAWHYALPKLKYGQWAAIATVSTHAYGAQGQQGSTETSSSSSSSYSFYNYANYLNYANSYYGNYYGSYYNPYYSNYLGGMYGPYGSYLGGVGTDDSDTETTTSVNTEVLPFTPLVFYIYVEPNE